ncbi:MAG: acylphosphatase [Thermoplasmatota archaeon]
MRRMHVIYHGRVQGVFFRANCQKKAVELGLTGWVKNLPDGTVESVAEGSEDKLQDLLHWCANSQPMAKVSEAKVEWLRATGEFEHFVIIR